MAINLRQVQKYRYTVFIFVGLLIALFGLFITELIYKQKQTPLAPISNIVAPTTDTLVVDWTKVKLGMTEDEVNKIFGKPSSSSDSAGVKSNFYEVNPLTPLATHRVVIKNNKAVEIRRNIDSVNEQVFYQQLIKQYGEPTILRYQTGVALPEIESYDMSNNQYLVAKVNRQTSRVFELLYMEKERYDLYKNIELVSEATENQGVSENPDGF